MDHSQHNSYKYSFALSNKIWEIVKRRDGLTQETIGKQLIRSADSISSNIAEGWARYYKKDKVLFFKYSRSSMSEIYDWIDKANVRNLLVGDEYSEIH